MNFLLQVSERFNPQILVLKQFMVKNPALLKNLDKKMI